MIDMREQNRRDQRGHDIRDLHTLAEIANEITRTRFPCSRRSLARWPLETTILNRRKLASLKQAYAIADEMISSAPRIMQDGRRLKSKS